MSWRKMLSGQREDQLAYLETAVDAALGGDSDIEFKGEKLKLDDLDKSKIEETASGKVDEETQRQGDKKVPGAYAAILGGYVEELRICRDRRRQLLRGHKAWLTGALASMYEKKKRMEGE